MDPDTLFACDDEKTFQFEESLPSLPVPTLEHTLDRYLDSVRPHLTNDEYRQTQFLVQQFGSGVGKDLHVKLLERAKHEKNWLDQWWTDYAYMDFRLPISPLLNFGGPGPYMHHIYKAKEGTQIERASFIFYYTLKFWQMVRKERLRVDRDSKGNKLSMSQFHKAYSTCRIPGVSRDHLNYYFKTESEGEAPRHMVVMCRGRIFAMDTLHSNDEPLTVPELQKQLQIIRDKCDRLPLGPGLGSLTGDNRTTWAQNRSRLIALHPGNYKNLEVIQSAQQVCVFEDTSPSGEEEVFLEALAGNSFNRWFDKSVTLVIFRNGLVASNCDHSPWDAMVLVASTYYIDLCTMRDQGEWKGSTEIQDMPEPQELEFVVDDVILQGISTAREVYNMYANNLQCSVIHFKDYGKNFLRKQKLYPDSHVQLALQYAYYKLYRKAAPTYETGTTRRYYHARTETVRSCTVEGIDWSKAMLDPATSMEKKAALYKAAADKQNRLMTEAQDNQGCDRHLLGLYILAKESGMAVPAIYTDPAYTKSGGNGNFVLSTSFTGYSTVYGGVVPMVEHGYGCFYRIEPEKTVIFVSSWKSGGQKDATCFNQTVVECLKEMGQLVEMASSKTARL